MNCKELLMLFDNVKDTFVQEAMESRAAVPVKKHIPRRLLIAAAIAAALLLAGCAAAYFWLQDMTIGASEYTQYLDDQGRLLEEPVETQRQVVTFSGWADSKAGKAAARWYAFQESYDPEGAYQTNIPDLPEIPNNYEYNYGCYTQEMVDMLDTIAAETGMELLEEWVPVQRWQSGIALQQGLGITTLLKPGAQAAMGKVQGMLYPPYNYSLEFYFQLTGEETRWNKQMLVEEAVFHKDYLPARGTWHLALEDFEQWSYTTSDGTALKMAINARGLGFVIAEDDTVLRLVVIHGNTTGSNFPSPDQVPGKEDLEQMAEAFDFRLPVTRIDAAAMAPAMEAAEAAWQAENTPVEQEYPDYEAYLLDSAPWLPEDILYVLHDLTGDGQPELLLGQPDGQDVRLYSNFSLTAGQLTENGFYGIPCQDGVMADHMRVPHSAEEQWTYYRPATSEHLAILRLCADGSWKMKLDPNADPTAPLADVTAQEAEAFQSQYPTLELPWRPLADYPLSTGRSLGEYLAGLERPVTREELHRLYRDFTAAREQSSYTHYCILDVNGDGMEDLVLSADGESCSVTYSYRYGQVMSAFSASGWLCENKVVEYTRTRMRDFGDYYGELEEHEFFTFAGWETVSLEYLVYNRAAGTWQTDLDGTAISEAEAQAIFAKYPRVEVNFLPVSEWIE